MKHSFWVATVYKSDDMRIAHAINMSLTRRIKTDWKLLYDCTFLLVVSQTPYNEKKKKKQSLLFEKKEYMI